MGGVLHGPEGACVRVVVARGAGEYGELTKPPR